MLQKICSSISGFFGFFGQKQLKLIRNEENRQNPNRLIKFSEIRYLDASQQKNVQQKNSFSILAFFGLMLAKKQPKFTKNVEDCQNTNRLMNFFEIWYVDTFQQKKMLRKN